jgi:ketosteroid isomerase-like protein
MAGTQQAQAAETAVASTAEVFERHLQAFLAGDADALLADYAPDARFCLPDRTATGPAAIGAILAWVAGLFPRGQTQFEVLRQEVHGDCAYLAWRASSPALEPSTGADTFVVRDGKIVFQSFGGQLNVKGS